VDKPLDPIRKKKGGERNKQELNQKQKKVRPVKP
jgi:hypothetical protein